MAQYEKIREELYPVKPEGRFTGSIGYTLMIIAMAISTSIFFLGWIPVVFGLSLVQALITGLLGNLFVALLMTLNGWVGTKEGIPYAMQLRTSFGNRGSLLPMTVRMIVSLLWYGIDGFIAGWAMTEMVLVVAGWSGDRIIAEGMQYIVVFFIIYLIAVVIIGSGKIKTIKLLDAVSGPLLFIFFGWFLFYLMGLPQFAGVNLPIWSGGMYGGEPWFGTAVLTVLAFQAMYWTTISVNVSDICRYNKGTKTLIPGHFIGLVVPQTVAIGLGFAACYFAGGNLSPIDIIAKYSPTPLLGVIGLGFAFLATSTTNLTGDIPATTNAAIKIFGVSWNKALIIATVIAFFIAPWWYVSNSLGMAYQLVNFTYYYGIFLGPIIAIMIVDYWLVRKRKIFVDELYKGRGVYYYQGGILWAGVGSFIIGIIGQYVIAFAQGGIYYAWGIPLPGLETVWVYGIIIAGAAYYLWAAVDKKRVLPELKEKLNT
jgi:NCS1 family nucleobase:cation symporter-1